MKLNRFMLIIPSVINFFFSFLNNQIVLDCFRKKKILLLKKYNGLHMILSFNQGPVVQN